MTSLLDNYEQQFGTITASITAKTAKLSTPNLGDDRRAGIQQIVKEMEEARDILEQMGLEIRELPPPMKSKYQTRIQSFTAELTRLENEFKKTRDSYERKREELLGEGSEENLYSQKQRLIDNSEKLERGSKRLDVGYRVAIETEQIGNEILTDLNEQRETIQRTRNRLRETDEELGRSGRLLNRMVMRVMQNRLVILGLLLLILFVIIVGVYFTVRKKH